MGLSTPHTGGHALSMALVCLGTYPLCLLHEHLTHPGYAEQRLSLLMAARPLPAVRPGVVWSEAILCSYIHVHRMFKCVNPLKGCWVGKGGGAGSLKKIGNL